MHEIQYTIPVKHVSQDIPQDIQQKIKNHQTLQANLQGLTDQRRQLELQLREITAAKEYIEKLGDDATLYKSIGGLMIKAEKQAAESDLNEQEEILNVRVKRIVNNIEKTQPKLEELTKEINNSLKNRLG